MNKKLILHVGCEKTGTKSIQRVLADSRSSLAELGIIYPVSLGYENHTKVIAAAQDHDVIDNIRAHIFSNTWMSSKNFKIDLKEKLQSELSNFDHWHTLIVSTELIHSRLIYKSEIRRLFELFEDIVSDIEIVIFLRRQDELAVSRFGTAIRAGHKNFDNVFDNIGEFAYIHLPEDRVVNDYKYYYDFKELIQRFEPHVPKQNIKIALYSGMYPSTNSVKKFFQLAGIDNSLMVPETENLNTAISVEAQYVISKLNHKIRKNFPSGNRNIKYTKLQHQIIKDLPGEKRMVNRGDAEGFFNSFSETNEWVRKTYFPNQNRLFELDFHKYPENIDYSNLPHLLDERVSIYLKKYGTFKNMEGFASRIKRYLKCATYKIHAGNSLKWEMKKFVRRYIKILKKNIKKLRDYLTYLYLKLNRRVKIFSKKKLYKNNGVELKDRKILSEFLIIRILGNDHYPIHSEDQTLNNLKFILKNEPDFKDCRKCFVLNRIIDRSREQDLIDLLERYSVDYLRIPFESREYAKTGWRVEDFEAVDYFSSEKFYGNVKEIKKRQIIWAIAPKINYVMNINSARNMAIEEGKRTANWTFVLDGNCIFKEKDFSVLSTECTQNTFLPYIIIPYARLSGNAEYLNNDVIPEAKYEPQIGFHFTAKECFNSHLPYGIVDKAELLKILGVPGKWTFWGDFPWQKNCSRRIDDRYLYKISESIVLRLSSGRHGLKIPESAQSRFQSRLDSIVGTIQYLTSRYGSENRDFQSIILNDKNLALFQLREMGENQ